MTTRKPTEQMTITHIPSQKETCPACGRPLKNPRAMRRTRRKPLKIREVKR